MKLFDSTPSPRLFLLVLICAVVVAILYPVYTSNVRLGGKVRQMRRYEPQLQEVLHSDSRFLETRTVRSTSGWLDVHGSVASPWEFDALVRLVQSTDPPVRVHVSVSAPLLLPGQREAIPISMKASVGPDNP